MDQLANITPAVINAVGLAMSVIGAFILALDSLAPIEFVSRLEETGTPWRARMTRIGFIAQVNRVFVFVFIAVAGIIGLSIVLPLGLALLLGPVVFFVWRLFAWIADLIDRFVDDHLSPTYANRFSGTGWGCLLYLTLAIAWVVVRLVVFAIAIIIRFGIDLPFRALSEFVVAPIVLRLFTWAARVHKEEARWGFRALAFRGVLFLMFGFGYQLVAVFWDIARRQ